jgi:fructokinase
MPVETKGIVTIAVEDDAILMMYGTLKRDREGKWVDHEYLPANVIERSPAAPDGNSDDWREIDPEVIFDHFAKFVNECLNADPPRAVDAIGLSIFGNVSIDGTIVTNITNRQTGRDPRYQRNFEMEMRKRIPGLSTGCKFVLRNDATAAAHGELHMGKGKARSNAFAYVWLGRGVNCGVIIDGQSWLGLMHPEVGHTMPRLHPDDDVYIESTKDTEFPCCVIHRDCLLALASSRSIQERLFVHKIEQSKVVEIYSYYVAQLCLSITLTIAPARIVLGGMVLRREILPSVDVLEEVKSQFVKMLGGFPSYTQIAEKNLQDYVSLSDLDDTASMIGIVEAVKAQMNLFTESSQ